MISQLGFILSESFKGLFRAKLQAFISSVTISITLIVFSMYCLGKDSDNLVPIWS